MRQGRRGSNPLALETMALSTIEIAGATVRAEMVAALASTAIRANRGDLSSGTLL